MFSRKLYILAALLSLCGVITPKGQVTSLDPHARLLQVAEDIDENVEDLEDGIDDIGDEIEDMEDEIEDFGEEIEDMKTGVEAVGTEIVGLREEVKTMRSVFETGLEEIREKAESETFWLGDRVMEVKNWTQSLRDDTQYIKEEAMRLGESVSENMSQLKEALTGDTKVGSLGEQLHNMLANITENHLDFKEEIAKVRENLRSEVNSVEDKLCDNHREVKEELATLQRDMNSTLYLLRDLRSQLINLRQENSDDNQNILAGSCSELRLNSRSGYYWLRGLSEQVYCDMNRQSCGCGSTSGWMRVADIDMTDPNQQCPGGFRLRSGTSKRMCEMTTESAGCTSVTFRAHSVQYNRVCGRVKAYQYGSPDAFYSYHRDHSHTVDSMYVDGVSITHGQNPRKHIWTFAAAVDEIQPQVEISCPCLKATSSFTGIVPPLIGNDYFCDTGSSSWWRYSLYSDPLWDGQGCGPTSSCCQFNSPPWFCKKLPQPTTDDIELRVCRNEDRSNEDIPFEVIELYIQ